MRLVDVYTRASSSAGDGLGDEVVLLAVGLGVAEGGQLHLDISP